MRFGSMRTALLPLCLMLASAAPAAAQAPPADVVFTGSTVIEAETAQCGNTVGFEFRSTFAPRNVGGNDANTYWTGHFDFFGRFATVLVTATDADIAGNGTYLARAIGPFGMITFRGSFLNAASNPVVIDTTTRSVTVRSKLTNWFATTGCTITVRGSFVRAAGPNSSVRSSMPFIGRNSE